MNLVVGTCLDFCKSLCLNECSFLHIKLCLHGLQEKKRFFHDAEKLNNILPLAAIVNSWRWLEILIRMSSPCLFWIWQRNGRFGLKNWAYLLESATVSDYTKNVPWCEKFLISPNLKSFAFWNTYSSLEMFFDEEHILGFFNFAFSMQIKNFSQPLSC